MTDIDLAQAHHVLRVERSNATRNGVYLALIGGPAHLTPSEARRLRDELNNLLGECREPVRGDRVVIEVEAPDGSHATNVGKTGTLTVVDRDDDDLPYYVEGDDGGAYWCHSVRLADGPEDKTAPPADEEGSAAPVAGADFFRRLEAAVKAKELLSGTMTPGVYGASPEALMRVADWLLGETA